MSDSDTPALRKRPEFQSLLDQLETNIERDVSSPGVLTVLSLKLFALHRQRGRLGQPIAVDEQVGQSQAKIETPSLVDPEATAPNRTPSALAKTMTANKLQAWMGRRRPK